MIAITENEKRIIRKKYPNVHIVRTMRQDSKRHHYYMTEDKKPMRLLNTLRNLGKPHFAKGRAQDRNCKNER